MRTENTRTRNMLFLLCALRRVPLGSSWRSVSGITCLCSLEEKSPACQRKKRRRTQDAAVWCSDAADLSLRAAGTCASGCSLKGSVLWRWCTRLVTGFSQHGHFAVSSHCSQQGPVEESSANKALCFLLAVCGCVRVEQSEVYAVEPEQYYQLKSLLCRTLPRCRTGSETAGRAFTSYSHQCREQTEGGRIPALCKRWTS